MGLDSVPLGRSLRHRLPWDNSQNNQGRGIVNVVVRIEQGAEGCAESSVESLGLGAWGLGLGAWSLGLGAWSLGLGAWSLDKKEELFY